MDEVQHDQNAPAATVAIVEGMDRFKLVMGDGSFDERVNPIVSPIKEFLPFAHQGANFVRRRRGKDDLPRAIIDDAILLTSVTVLGRYSQALMDTMNHACKPEGYAVWEIHPVMALHVDQ